MLNSVKHHVKHASLSHWIFREESAERKRRREREGWRDGEGGRERDKKTGGMLSRKIEREG